LAIGLDLTRPAGAISKQELTGGGWGGPLDDGGDQIMLLFLLLLFIFHQKVLSWRCIVKFLRTFPLWTPAVVGSTMVRRRQERVFR
jgi:hypothetical protein